MRFGDETVAAAVAGNLDAAEIRSPRGACEARTDQERD